MRILAILGVFAAVLVFPMTANAQPASTQTPNTQGKSGKGQNLGAIRDKCRAEAVGYGSNKAAQVRACVERAKRQMQARASICARDAATRC